MENQDTKGDNEETFVKTEPADVKAEYEEQFSRQILKRKSNVADDVPYKSVFKKKKLESTTAVSEFMAPISTKDPAAAAAAVFAAAGP